MSVASLTLPSILSSFLKSLLALLVASLAACLAPRNSSSGALVDPSSPYRQLIQAAVTDLEPKIIQMLGTRWEWSYIVEVDQEYDHFRAETRTWDRRVKLGAQSLKPGDLEFVLAHELAHVHMTDKWRDLPLMLQEGVANWVAISATGRTAEFGGPKPSPRLLIDVMTIPYDEFKKADAVRQGQLEYAATWLATNFFPPEEMKPSVDLRQSSKDDN